jgi:octaprenyl-diphosphate synthase
VIPVAHEFPEGIFHVSIEAIRQVIENDMHTVDGIIRAQLHSDVVLVRQVAEYIIHSGGKRLRPALLLLSAGAFGPHAPHRHELAAVVEFIHTATLLHDDVVDASHLRRGNPTANAAFGNPASVLVGDFIYTRAFQMMVRVNDMRVMEVLADATNVVAEGEVLQLMNCHDADVDEARYLRVIRYKTAKLFEASARLGAIVANATPEDETAMAEYGMRLGTAFQIIDDVLDYSGDSAETGKNVGDDLAEGKPTLPLIHVLRHGTPEEAATVRRAIETGSAEDMERVIRAIRQTGALEYAKAKAKEEADAAIAAIAHFPGSSHKDSLLQLADFAVARSF